MVLEVASQTPHLLLREEVLSVLVLTRSGECVLCMSIVTRQLPPDLRWGSRRLEMEVEATLGTRHQLSPSLGTCTRAEVRWF